MKQIGKLKKRPEYGLFDVDVCDRIIYDVENHYLNTYDKNGRLLFRTDKINYPCIGGVAFLGLPRVMEYNHIGIAYVNDPCWCAGNMKTVQDVWSKRQTKGRVEIKPFNDKEEAIAYLKANVEGPKYLEDDYELGPDKWEAI